MMLNFLLGCWFGCFGGFMLAALLRKAGDSPSESAEGSAPSRRDARPREMPHGLSERAAPSVN